MPRGVYDRSPELIEKLRATQRATHLGRKASPATLVRMSAATRGKAKPQAWKTKMSGEGNGRFRHGMTRTPTWWSWAGMKTRCLNPESEGYENWGGRGITICDRWLIFENFLADMGERPEGMSLDRIDNDGNYEPGNCRWATPKEQRANQRRAA